MQSLHSLAAISLLLLAQFTVPFAKRVNSGGSSGPVFDTGHSNMCSLATTCAVTVVNANEALVISVTDLDAGNTITAISDSAGTLTPCTGFPQTFNSFPYYMYKETGASIATHTITLTWNTTSTFSIISINPAYNVTSVTCGSTIFNTGSVSTTADAAGPSFTNSANALALCFISVDAGYTITSHGSTFTMTDTDDRSGASQGQGSIASAGTNNCSWNIAAGGLTHFAQATAVLQ